MTDQEQPVQLVGGNAVAKWLEGSDHWKLWVKENPNDVDLHLKWMRSVVGKWRKRPITVILN